MKAVDVQMSSPSIGLADWLRSAGVGAAEAAIVRESTAADEAERERLRLFDEARERGYCDGMRRADEAVKEAEAEAHRRVTAANEAEAGRLRSERERFAALVATLPNAVGAVEAAALDAAIDIALTAMSRWFGERQDGDGALAMICRRALDECGHRPVTLKVALRDLDDVRRACGADGVRVVADNGVQPGACELESAWGTYATGIDLRLAALRDALRAPDGNVR